MRILTVITAAAVSLSATTALAAELAGEVMDVTPAANVSRQVDDRTLTDGSTLDLEDELNVGDLVATGAVGKVLILFEDQTKIAISYDTKFGIDGPPDHAGKDRITLSLKIGSLRVITGKRPGEYAYEGGFARAIPLGTAFDITVLPNDVVELVLLKGEVRLCGEGDDCETVKKPCAMLRAEPKKSVEEITLENGRVEATRNNFPFLRSQSSLLEEFRFEGLGCTEDPGGLGVFALDGPAIRVGVPVTAAIILCLVLCPGGGGGPTIDTNNATN